MDYRTVFGSRRPPRHLERIPPSPDARVDRFARPVRPPRPARATRARREASSEE